jgi:hypothetical protein
VRKGSERVLWGSKRCIRRLHRGNEGKEDRRVGPSIRIVERSMKCPPKARKSGVPAHPRFFPTLLRVARLEARLISFRRKKGSCSSKREHLRPEHPPPAFATRFSPTRHGPTSLSPSDACSGRF